MNSSTIQKLAFSLIATVAMTLLASAALAQSLGLAPAEVQATFIPGQPFQFEVGVSNDGPNPVVMKASVMDFWYNPQNEKIFGPPGALPRSASNWIEFVPRNFTVPAHGTCKVKVTVTPPISATGGYYAVLFLESKPELVREASLQTKALYANVRLGSLILLTAAKTEQESVQVSDAELSAPAENRNLTLKFLLSNNSNTHLFPQPRLAVLDAKNKVVARAESDSKRFLPGQKGWIEVPWAGVLPPGNYKAILTLCSTAATNCTPRSSRSRCPPPKPARDELCQSAAHMRGKSHGSSGPCCSARWFAR